MSYRLDLEEPVPAALREAAAAELADAAALLEGGEAAEAAVHAARKDLKKARSLLRLARPRMPGRAYRRENRRLRDTARAIAGVRDADVMVATVDDLAERFAGQLPEGTFAALRAELAIAAAEARTGREQAEPGAAAAELRDAVERARAWPLEDCDEDTLVAGITLAYASGRRDLRAAERDPSAEHLHEWRKRVKDLWHHLRLLRDLHPEVLPAEAEAAHRLSDLLGDDHDLAELCRVLAEKDGPAASVPDDLAPLAELAAERQEALRSAAFALGHRIYAEPAKSFSRRFRALTRARRVGTPA